MNSISRIRNNFFFLSAADFTAKSFGFLLYIVLARYLGPEQFGIYSLGVSFWLIYGLLANLGFDPVIIRDVSRDPSKSESYFSQVVFYKLITGTLAYLGLLGTCYLMDYAIEVRHTILIFGCLLFINPLNNSQQSIFKAHQTMSYVALMEASRAIIKLAVIPLIIAVGLGVQAVAGSHLLIALILFVIFYHFILKKNFCRFSFKDVKFYNPLLKSALPFGFLGLTYIVNRKLDILIISKMIGVESVGWYNAANELVAVLGMLPTTLSTVLFPSFSASYGRSELKQLTNTANFVIKLINVIGIPSGVGIFLLAPEIINLIYGPNYSQSAIVLKILSPVVCFLFARSVLSWLLTAVDQINILMKIVITTLVINISIDIWLIPHYGYAAAAFGVVVSTFFAYISVCWNLRRRLDGLILFKSSIKPILACLPMIAVLFICDDFHLFIKIGIAILVYVAAAFLFSVFDKNEIEVIKKIVVPGQR